MTREQLAALRQLDRLRTGAATKFRKRPRNRVAVPAKHKAGYKGRGRNR